MPSGTGQSSVARVPRKSSISGQLVGTSSMVRFSASSAAVQIDWPMTSADSGTMNTPSAPVQA